MSRALFAAHGETNAGHARSGNEDCFLIDPALGLYLVLDGMGGHQAGDVAAALGRDAIREYVATHRGRKAPRQLLEGAVRSASTAIFTRARQNRELHGMGTTMVGCLALDAKRVLVAHVGDSRAYLLRDGKLILLTTDHTVVAELVARGGLSLEDAERHPYKSVLSRNLGGKADAQTEVLEIELVPGDRVLLCSDGLNGYASHQAMEQVLASAADPARAALDLIELALRGGGGDNVTALVLETERPVEHESTLILRKSAASAWWGRRELFLAEARTLGVASSPICAVLSPDEAIAIVAGNLFEAISHDLEQTTGIYVWTYAENLASGWLDQGGAVSELRQLVSRLDLAVAAVVAEVAGQDASLALVLEAAVARALVVAEMAMAAVIGERLRHAENNLATAHGEDTMLPTLVDEKTRPFERLEQREPPSPEVVACLEVALAATDGRLRQQGSSGDALATLAAVHKAALAGDGPDAMLGVARELFGGRMLTEAGLGPLIDELDRMRRGHLAVTRSDSSAHAAARAAALRHLVTAHQTLDLAIAALVSDAAAEIGDGVRDLTVRTATLRDELGRGEARLSRLERDLRSDATLSGRRATTEVDG